MTEGKTQEETGRQPGRAVWKRKILVISVFIMAIAGGGYLASLQPGAGGPVKHPVEQPAATTAATDGGDALDRLSLPDIDFDLSVSPIPPFELSNLDVGPSLPRSVLTGINLDGLE